MAAVRDCVQKRTPMQGATWLDFDEMGGWGRNGQPPGVKYLNRHMVCHGLTVGPAYQLAGRIGAE